MKQYRTKSIERRLNAFIFDLLERDRITKQQYYFLRSSDLCAPRLYDFPKVHKKDFSMRPIVSFINSPLYNLSKYSYLSKLLSPLVGKTKFTVKNFFQFADLLKNVDVESNECMVSFDIVSLFTKIPINLAKDVACEQLTNDVTLSERIEMTINGIEIALNFCLNNLLLLLLLLLSASPYSESPQRNSILHFTRSSSSSSLAPTLSISSLTKSIHLPLAFLFSFCLAPSSPSSSSPRSLLLSFLRVHTNAALHFQVCLPALQFSRSLSRIRFISCPFLSLPMPISPFSTLQLPFFPPVFPSLPLFPFHKAWLV